MTHFYVRGLVLLLVVFAFTLFLAHTQPYDDSMLRELLLPVGCPAPCFMGIRPGVTTMEEAFELLKSNAWVSDIRKSSGTISWMWNDTTPNVIDRRYRGYAQHSNVPSEECCVGSVKFNSLFTVGDLYLLLGEPPRTNLILGETLKYALVSISYVDQRIRVFTQVGCPINRRQFWLTPMETYIESSVLYTREGGVSAKIEC